MKTQFEKGELVWVIRLDGAEEKLEFIGMPTQSGECWILRRPKTGQLIYLQTFESITEVVVADEEKF